MPRGAGIDGSWLIRALSLTSSTARNITGSEKESIVTAQAGLSISLGCGSMQLQTLNTRLETPSWGSYDSAPWAGIAAEIARRTRSSDYHAAVFFEST